MSEIWETKDGLRRVRRDPPTVDDAALAAQGLTEDLEGQVEIVISLMSVPADEARRAVLKMRRSDETRLTIPGRGGNARRCRRTQVGAPDGDAPRASVGRRGLG